MRTDQRITRRTFSTLLGAGAALAPSLLLGESANAAPDGGSPAPLAGAAHEADALQSEFLMELVLEKGAASNVGPPGATRVVVAIAGGTFQGPKLRGTLVAPSADWLSVRPDGSSLVDIRALMQTDDEQKIYLTCRGIAYPVPGDSLHSRILPFFETASARYAWLNNVVAVGVLRPVPAKISYRVFQIL
jgi:hypothetical protein